MNTRNISCQQAVGSIPKKLFSRRLQSFPSICQTLLSHNQRSLVIIRFHSLTAFDQFPSSQTALSGFQSRYSFCSQAALSSFQLDLSFSFLFFFIFWKRDILVQTFKYETQDFSSLRSGLYHSQVVNKFCMNNEKLLIQCD